MLIVVLIVATAILWIVDGWIEKKFGFNILSYIIALVVTLVTVIYAILSILNYFGLAINYDANVEIYNSLQARIENYNGFNDPFLPQDVQDWNKDITKIQNMNRNIWTGFSVPDSYEDFEVIPYDFLN